MVEKNPAGTDEERYRQSCQSGFWQAVFKAEAEYLARHLQGCTDVLSVGCGPAVVERELSGRGFRITGLDVSPEALDGAPDVVRPVVGRAENLPFADRSFDAIIYVVSLQFMEDYRQAVEEAARVLRPKGKLLAMLLNPESGFYKSKMADPSSYVRKIRHVQTGEIEECAREKFQVENEYFLGVKDQALTKSRDSREAALYVIRGVLLN
ncbi:class I SAM-dependent methyltransferase [candidate division FCPU426 bacterium]|nr:class I SAM-dependent methyltransferase [candidate division FCPU426 bacterium]